MERIKRFILAGILTVVIGSNVYAQDVHFSQFYASPMTLNPAMTGWLSCDYRFSANYRNQWSSIMGPLAFKTFSAAYDMQFLRGKLKGGDFVGGGAMLMSDKAGHAVLSDQKFMLSGSYHKNLGKNNLALGVQFGMVQKSINIGPGLTFPLDYERGEFVPAVGAADPITNNSILYPDFSTGLLWYSNITPKVDAFAGWAMFHVTQPKESFYDDSDNKLPSRQVIHGGARINVTPEIDIVPNFIYMNQKKASELNFGGAVEYALDGPLGMDAGVSLGGWYRNKDAGIVVLGIDYMNMKFGFSYDFTVSNLSVETNNKGGFELSMIYIGCLAGSGREPVLLPCPRF